jgi:riboflavin transporter FmnP
MTITEEHHARAGTAAGGRRGGTRAAQRTRVLVRVGMLGAAAFALMFTEFNIPGFPVFLQYDPGDVPALIGGIAMGPLAGAGVSLVKGVLFLLSGKDEAGWLGTAANLATSLSLVLTAALVYARVRTRKGAVLGLALGTLTMVGVMAVLNYYFFLPIWGVPPAALGETVRMTMLFNLLKGVLTSTLTFLVYKKVSPLLRA